ncbi:LLM class flavin-dependent oxidoreductase [Paenibacillus sp. GCM10023252]|uniref:LLM class flavin-dependent oxidoreductase n=1 Tax=Paenibacillus sp. GCM10023252 TaxID=3252649 RepID=UPI0036123E7E
MRLSVLDQTPVPQGKTASEALQYTVRLAQETERLGYQRFWVSEHHASTSLAGSSPEVLISHLAAKTSRLRIGSGGVMLPHYSAYKVAENFKLLEALYPGRIDVGLGRAPGGMPLATRALQEGKTRSVDRYPQQIADLADYLYNTVSEHSAYAGLIASPLISTAPEVWLLGSSGDSATIAGQQGAAFAFAHFINGQSAGEAFYNYHLHFRPSRLGDKPKTILALFVLCADTDDEAERLASSGSLFFLKLIQGMESFGFPTVETALAYPYTDMERAQLNEYRQRNLVGSPAKVKEGLLRYQHDYKPDELMIVTITHDIEARIRSYQLIAEAMGL